MSDDDISARESLSSAERARRDIDAALSELADMDNDAAEVVPDAVEAALTSAKNALAAERTECRKQTPYSELTLVGDSGGLHYVCSHRPTAHEYPL